MKVILTAAFKHETNRYAEGVTDLELFRQRNAVFGDTAIRAFFKGAQQELQGFFDYFDEKDSYLLKSVVALNASPGPKVEQSVWEMVKDEMLKAIAAEPQLDGILLALHGAMVTEKYEDGEGELLEAIRNAVGPDLPIVVTLDLHANMTQKMMRHATAYFPYDYYPHTDIYESALRAADCMYRTLEGKIKPVMRWNKLDMIFPVMPTEHPAFVPFLKKAQQLRDSGELVNVNICHGFFASDLYEQGAAVLAVSDADEDLAQETADAFAREIFAARASLRKDYWTAEAAVEYAMEAAQHPVVLAEVSDNPGSGASCDATLLLRTLIEKKAKGAAVAVVLDPETVQQAIQAGIGSTIHVSLGGKIAPEITGGPIECSAYVKAITDGCYYNRDKMAQGLLVEYGKTVLLKIDDILVIVVSYKAQPWDLEVYRHIGIQPQDMKILMVKSAAHFRASYGKVAAQIVDVQTPGLAPPSPEMLPLAHSRRPIYPLDDL